MTTNDLIKDIREELAAEYTAASWLEFRVETIIRRYELSQAIKEQRYADGGAMLEVAGDRAIEEASK